MGTARTATTFAGGRGRIDRSSILKWRLLERRVEWLLECLLGQLLGRLASNFERARRPPRHQRHGQRHEKDSRQMVGAHINRIEIARERQQHYGVARTG